jgi:hypothetical protein
MFYPFFTTPPAGRGYKQFDAGAAAARHVWLLIDEDLADFQEEVPAIAQLLEGKDKHARRNAAYVTGCMAFRRGMPTTPGGNTSTATPRSARARSPRCAPSSATP